MAGAFFIPMTNTFESYEEQYFDWWLQDLIKAGFIRDEVIYQPESFVTVNKQTYTTLKVMKTKTKEVEKTLVQERVYTPDFKVYWTKRAKGIFYKLHREVEADMGAPFWANQDEGGAYTIFEVKGQFDAKNMTRLAAINIDVVLEKHDVVIEMAKVGNKKGGIFHKTFTPGKYFMTDKSIKARKLHYDASTLGEFVKERNAKIAPILEKLLTQ